jgi:hypothetical protein
MSSAQGALQALDFTDAATWDVANPDITTLGTGGVTSLTFNNVLGNAGLTLIVSSSGTFSEATLVSTAGLFDNRSTSTNTFTFEFNQLVGFQVENTTHHNANETDILTLTGGTWDQSSFVIIDDLTTPAGSTLPIDFTSTNVAEIGPHEFTGPQSGENFPEWTIEGTGSILEYTHEVTGGNQRITFSLQIDVDVIPEPSSTLLLGLGSLSLLARRKRA